MKVLLLYATMLTICIVTAIIFTVHNIGVWWGVPPMFILGFLSGKIETYWRRKQAKQSKEEKL